MAEQTSTDSDPANGSVRFAARTVRRVLDESESGAPSAGEAVRDIFSTDEIFQRIIATADEEFSSSNRRLFLSGVAAGLSIGLSFLARAAVTAKTGDASALASNLLYPVGFLLIVMGRYQLYTENTLTPVTLILTRIASLPVLLRVWGVVLTANLLGAALLALVLASTNVFSPEMAEAARSFGEHALSVPWRDLFWKGVFAGWIVASMVWLTHAARSSTTRLLTVFALMLLIPTGDLFHCIIGACETFYLVFQGAASIQASLSFVSAVVLGNTVGGVLLVAILNYAQTREARFPDRDCGQLELTWREWLFGHFTGHAGSRPDTDDGRLSADVTEDDHVFGPDDAGITYVQYGDYECSTSRDIFRLVEAMLNEHGDAIRYVYRHLPLSRRHSNAQRAAEAAEAAAAQGKFWEMHALLFKNYDRLRGDALTQYAEALDLDLDQFEQALDEETYRDDVLADRRSGISNGVRETNNLFINGKRYEGDVTLEEVREATEQLGMLPGTEEPSVAS